MGNLEETLAILRKNGVEHFKCKEFAVKFHIRAYLTDPLVDNNQPEEKPKFEFNQAAVNEDELFYSSEG